MGPFGVSNAYVSVVWRHLTWSMRLYWMLEECLQLGPSQSPTQDVATADLKPSSSFVHADVDLMRTFRLWLFCMRWPL